MGKPKTLQNIERDRMIHVRLSAETHRRLRILVADKDVTIQEWVNSLVENSLNHSEKGKSKS